MLLYRVITSLKHSLGSLLCMDGWAYSDVEGIFDSQRASQT